MRCLCRRRQLCEGRARRRKVRVARGPLRSVVRARIQSRRRASCSSPSGRESLTSLEGLVFFSRALYQVVGAGHPVETCFLPRLPAVGEVLVYEHLL